MCYWKITKLVTSMLVSLSQTKINHLKYNYLEPVLTFFPSQCFGYRGHGDNG